MFRSHRVYKTVSAPRSTKTSSPVVDLGVVGPHVTPDLFEGVDGLFKDFDKIFSDTERLFDAYGAGNMETSVRRGEDVTNVSIKTDIGAGVTYVDITPRVFKNITASDVSIKVTTDGLFTVVLASEHSNDSETYQWRIPRPTPYSKNDIKTRVSDNVVKMTILAGAPSKNSSFSVDVN